MYIDSINIYNIGPIDKCVIKSKFNENGNPLPVVIIGDNGKGKTILSSYIADALIEIAKKNDTYKDVVNFDGALYKIVGGRNIKYGKSYGLSIISFLNKKNFSYIEKTETTNLQEVSDDLEQNSNYDNIKNKILSDSFIKGITDNIDTRDIKQIFENNVLCFFPSYRSEKPYWLNDKAIKYNEIYNQYEHFNGYLDKEIVVDHSVERNTQWVQSVITDSLIDITYKDEKHPDNLVINGDWKRQQELRKARNNLEKLLELILKVDSVNLLMNYRNQNNGFRIEYKNNHETHENGIISGFKNLSLGQAVLFNMFATIIRHADINNIDKSINLSEITGIVAIDEIDLHLDSEMQYDILPKLIGLFPKVQFIITTHSPLFLLGMDKQFKENYVLLEMPNGKITTTEKFSEFENSYKVLKETSIHEKELSIAIENKIKDMKESSSNKTLIITEGPTDWRHIKYALNKFRKNEGRYLDLDIDFLEYDDNFGEDELVKMKDSLQMLPNNKKYILIADRDTNKKAVEELEEKGNYKKWKNNVYSFRIPVPETRKETPSISIEHYYSDEELKTEIICDDSIKRRMYMGSDFNKIGLNIIEKKRCGDRNKCGENKICIISGNGNEKVFDINDDDGQTTNFALSKKDFVERIVADESREICYQNFSLILDKIKEIIQNN